MKLSVTILIIILFVPAVNCQEELNLQTAVSLALKNNFSILIAKNELEAADNNITAGTSELLPRLNSDASYIKSHTDSDQEYFDGRVVQRDNAVATNFSAGISLNWTIFDGLGMFASLERFKALRESSEINLKNEIETNIASVVRSYYDIVRLYGRLEVVERTLAVSEERFRITESMKEVGSASKFELLQAQVDLNEDRSLFLAEELSLFNAKSTMNILLGRDPSYDFIINDTILIAGVFQLDDLKELTINNNSELKLAGQSIQLAKLDVRLAASNWFPQIDLRAGYDYVRSESQAGFLKSNKTSGFNYGILASFNLFNGFNTRLQHENARIFLENSEIRFAEIRNRIEAVLFNTYKRYEISLHITELETENYKASEENVAIAMERLKLGNITPLEFRETQLDLLNAKNRLMNAQFEAKNAETELLRLTGQLLREKE